MSQEMWVGFCKMERQGKDSRPEPPKKEGRHLDFSLVRVCYTSASRNCKIINLCHSKPLGLQRFMTMIENEYTWVKIWVLHSETSWMLLMFQSSGDHTVMKDALPGTPGTGLFRMKPNARVETAQLPGTASHGIFFPPFGWRDIQYMLLGPLLGSVV